MKRVGVIGIPGAWSSERLADALERRTGYRRVFDITELSLDLEAGRVWAGEVEVTALDGLIIKKIGKEYSPEHLERLELLRFVQERGVPCFSRPERIAAMIDRMACTVALNLADIPMPPTVITENVDAAVAAVERFGAAVFKPMFSTKARGMQIIEAGDGARAAVEAFQAAGHRVMYIQRRAELPGYDLGVAFLGGEYLATYARVAADGAWNTTFHSGGKYRGHDPGVEIVEIARRAQAPFGLEFTCVDVAETPDGPVVWEVSAFGGFHGLLDGCGIDAAERYVEHVLGRIADE